MDEIAFLIGETFLYWNSVILTLAAGTAVCIFLFFYLRMGGRGLTAAAAIPTAILFSLVLARLVHWYCRWDSYSGFLGAMTDYSSGGYALMGAFAGCLLTAVLLFLLRMEEELPRMLDAMCLGGGIGIALGRLACFYTAADRGQILNSVRSLPWAWPVTNAVSGAVEYRLATFLIQAMAAGAVFLALSVYSFCRKRRSGDITLLFLLLYGASQAVLDSTRYDSLYFRSNGFVSIVQILGAVSMVAVSIVFSVNLARKTGFRKIYLAYWIPMAAAMGCAGYMEYYVQRHGDRAVFAYSVMSLCLLGVSAAAVTLFILGRRLTGNLPQLPENLQ